MDIQNSEKVMDLLRMKSNVENLLSILYGSDDCSVIISAKAKNDKGKFVFLDKRGVEDASSLLLGMQSRIENELEGM